LSTRSVVTLVDLDRELTHFLNLLGLPSFLTLSSYQHIIRHEDPLEIVIDRDTSVVDPIMPQCFSDFGIGPLHAHPLIASFFGSSLSTPLKREFDAKSILKVLLDYLMLLEHGEDKSFVREHKSFFLRAPGSFVRIRV